MSDVQQTVLIVCALIILAYIIGFIILKVG
jgi:hypothetical protein